MGACVLQQPGGQLDAAADAGVLVRILEEDPDSGAVIAVPAADLVVVRLRKHRAKAGALAFSFSWLFQRRAGAIVGSAPWITGTVPWRLAIASPASLRPSRDPTP